jgi:uncharacterized protein (TIGR02466 family)
MKTNWTETNILNIFPIPVAVTKLNRNLTELERQILSLDEDSMVQNIGNKSSKNNYILNQEGLLQFKSDIETKLNEYFQNIWQPKTDVSLYITQSWLNHTKDSEYHHYHNHPNSFVSGVFYFEVDENSDHIVFHSPRSDETLQVVSGTYNEYNAKTWYNGVRNSQLILFPSWLNHSVDQKQQTNKRISLAFNSFLKGTLGDNFCLTELKL